MANRNRLIRNSFLLVALITLLSSASVCSAGWGGWGWGGFHRYVRPRVVYHHARYACRTYPRVAYSHFRHHWHRPVYRYGGCGIARHYVHLGLGYASRFASCHRPVRVVAPCYPRYYGCSTFRPYGVNYQPSTNYVNYHLPPIYHPAELNYGPQAVKQFMGVDRNFALGPLATVSRDTSTTRLVSLTPDNRRTSDPRASNVRTIDLARRYLDFGDARFERQEYNLAVQRYRTAAATAPDLADAHLRLGLALAATGSHESAVKAIARGLAQDPEWARRGFSLDDIYGGSRAAKIGQIEALAKTVLVDNGNADALYLLAVFMYLDGHKDRAQKLFWRAAELWGNAEKVRPFMPAFEAEAKMASLKF